MSYPIITQRFFTSLVTATMVLLFGCASTAPHEIKAGTYLGPQTAVGGGEAHSFVTIDEHGKPTAIGVRMSEGALTKLPATHPYDTPGVEFRVDLPKEAAIAGYDHVTVNWNPQGHIPHGVYDSPHFDFHFYMITPAERYNITLEGDDRARAQKQPSPEFMPEGYILPEGTAEPRMGAHAVNPGAPEFNHQPFTKTFIYGFYDGQMIFLEPMVSQAFLQSKPDTTANINLPKSYQRHAYYPTRYHVGYDPAKSEFVVAIEGLTYH